MGGFLGKYSPILTWFIDYSIISGTRIVSNFSWANQKDEFVWETYRDWFLNKLCFISLFPQFPISLSSEILNLWKFETALGAPKEGLEVICRTGVGYLWAYFPPFRPTVYTPQAPKVGRGAGEDTSSVETPDACSRRVRSDVRGESYMGFSVC